MLRILKKSGQNLLINIHEQTVPRNLKLPTLLEGEALAIWLELKEDEQATYATAKKSIVKAMMPVVNG